MEFKRDFEKKKKTQARKTRSKSTLQVDQWVRSRSISEGPSAL
jgi:hypothetical protein